MRTIKRAGDVCYCEHGTYRLEHELGKGGMGEVWAATEIDKGWNVAIKVMREDGVAARQRFRREAKLMRGLSHRNIVTLLDDGETDDGKPCLVLELLSGQTLSSWLREHGALPFRTAVQIARDVAAALAAAHEKDIVHRDLKPANVFLHDELGTTSQTVDVKVLDFGIAKDLGASDQTYATAVGIIIGSPGYMSPEQARGKDVDLRSDIWAFGMLLFEMIEGRRMFCGTRTQMVRQVLSAPIPPVPWRISDVPTDIDRLVASCLEHDPDKRIESARAVERELTRILESSVWERPATTENCPRLTMNHGFRQSASLATPSPTAVSVPESITSSIAEQTRVMIEQYQDIKRQLMYLKVGFAVLGLACVVALVAHSSPTFNNQIQVGPQQPASPLPPGCRVQSASPAVGAWAAAFLPKL